MKPIVEMCTCGHPQTMHHEQVHLITGRDIDGGTVTVELPISGHGRCRLCDCNKYTWTSGR